MKKPSRRKSTKPTTPEQAVDEFLAAPESLLHQEAEKTKAKMRKAAAHAETMRLNKSKSKETPSMEDLLADIIRVAEDEDTNPFAKFRSISRRRYELYGWFPISFVDQEFGQFEHAKQVAGLADQPGTRKWRAARAKESRRSHAQRYYTRYVHPFVAKPKTIDDLSGPSLILSISDTHATFLDPFTWAAFLQAIKDLRPAGVLFNGDILEGGAISRHPKVPGWVAPLQLELDFQREMFRQVREDAGFNGDLWLCGGNHEIDRLAMYLTQVSSGLAGLKCLRIDNLLGLADFGVQLMQGGTIVSPPGQEDEKRGFLLYDFYRIHHGNRLGKDPAAQELRDAGRSGQSGHVHRAQVYYGSTERDAGMSWMCTPCGCTDQVARSYIRGTNTGWQRGFGVAWLFPNGRVHQYPVITDGGVCHVEGHTYSTDGIKSFDPQKMWLDEFRPAR